MLDRARASELLQTAGQAGAELPTTAVHAVREVSGGDINHAWLIDTGAGRLFVKLNRREYLPMFEAERAGLEAIAACGAIVTCRPRACGLFADSSFLLLDALALQRDGDWAAAGRQLAQLHLCPQGQHYGFRRDSFCGTSPQPNTWNSNWARFFAHNRIGFQLSRLLGQLPEHPAVASVVQRVEQRLQGHQPAVSLVHGDLWRGNIGFAGGAAVIFDPAIYLGDAETDLAMSELFGAFPAPFYQAYHELLPASPDYRERCELYQLYHILNHANLFGGSYLDAARRRLATL